MSTKQATKRQNWPALWLHTHNRFASRCVLALNCHGLKLAREQARLSAAAWDRYMTAVGCL